MRGLSAVVARDAESVVMMEAAMDAVRSCAHPSGEIVVRLEISSSSFLCEVTATCRSEECPLVVVLFCVAKRFYQCCTDASRHPFCCIPVVPCRFVSIFWPLMLTLCAKVFQRYLLLVAS